MISIDRITVSELLQLVLSPDYLKWEVIPISRHRAKSYASNPRCSQADVVLYLAYIDSQLVGYRTVMPDTLLVNGKSIKIGWLSGNWVNPSLRRKGIASELFNAAYTDWEGKLLYTNYAIESKAVYDKASCFQPVETLHGIRLYTRPCLVKILPKRAPHFRFLLPVWYMLDFFMSLLNPLPFFAKLIKCKGISYEYLNYPDTELNTLLLNATNQTCTKRGERELEWIFRYPWLVSSPLGDLLGEKYFFSSSPKNFHQILVKVYRDRELLGFIMMNNVDGFISTPYIECNDSDANIFAKIIVKHASAMGAFRLTCYHPKISAHIKGLLPFGWFSIRQERNFFASKPLVNEAGIDNFHFLEGDGDCAFV
jgi:GNAT superfamily N-acetyltransferase